MDDLTNDHQCPAGIGECPLVSEVAQLRDRCQRLEALSYVDALTGIYNFRFLQRALQMEMERTRRTKLPTSLIMVDLDHFKNINTEHGHERGNVALSWVGGLLRENIRMIDIACRYGGEEFALVLPSTPLSQSANIAERLRSMICSKPVRLGSRKVTLTASFGVAVFNHFDNWTFSEFVSTADSLLYQAKAGGRNKVCSQEIAPAAPSGVTQAEKDALFTRSEQEEEEESSR